jgi:hypothetical protein
VTIGSSKVDRLLGAVHFYRQIGFFEQFGRVSDDQLAEQLNESYREKTYGRRDLRQARDLLDLGLLSLDRARVWWHDMEDDVFPGNNAYVRVLTDWAAISRGAFLPERVDERWIGQRGPVEVSFQLNGQIHDFRAEYDEWIDMTLLSLINRLIANSGMQFVPLVDQPRGS